MHASTIAATPRTILRGPGWWLAILGLIPVIFFIFSALTAAKLGATVSAWVPIFAAAAFGLIILFAVSTFTARQCREAALCWALVALLLAQVRGASVLNHGELAAGLSLLRREVNVSSLAEVRRAAVRWERQEPTRPIVVDESLRPLLLWELRDVKTVSYEPSPGRIQGSAILAPGAQPSLLENRTVLQVPVQDTTSEPSRSTPFGALLRWLLARDVPGEEEVRAILLVR
jgi:hypothetical protein